MSFWEEGVKHRICRKCGRMLTLDMFREKGKYLHRTCNDCKKKYAREYQRNKLSDPDKRATHNERVNKNNKKRKAEGEGQYVYLIKFPTGEYKIGRTNQPKYRLQNFNTSLPFELDFVVLIETDDMATLEKSLHERFWDKRIRGEWFNLSPEDVEYIQGLQS